MCTHDLLKWLPAHVTTQIVVAKNQRGREMHIGLVLPHASIAGVIFTIGEIIETIRGRPCELGALPQKTRRSFGIIARPKSLRQLTDTIDIDNHGVLIPGKLHSRPVVLFQVLIQSGIIPGLANHVKGRRPVILHSPTIAPTVNMENPTTRTSSISRNTHMVRIGCRIATPIESSQTSPKSSSAMRM